jgi:hypothetical protein
VRETSAYSSRRAGNVINYIQTGLHRGHLPLKPHSVRSVRPVTNMIVGYFPHDQTFSLPVNLSLGPRSTTKITLLGVAHRWVDPTVPPGAIKDVARHFVIVRLSTDVSRASSTFQRRLGHPPGFMTRVVDHSG